MQTCRNGHAMADQLRFCTACGAPVFASVPQRSNHRPAFIAGGVAMLLAVSGGAYELAAHQASTAAARAEATSTLPDTGSIVTGNVIPAQSLPKAHATTTVGAEQPPVPATTVTPRDTVPAAVRRLRSPWSGTTTESVDKSYNGKDCDGWRDSLVEAAKNGAARPEWSFILTQESTEGDAARAYLETLNPETNCSSTEFEKNLEDLRAAAVAAPEPASAPDSVATPTAVETTFGNRGAYSGSWPGNCWAVTRSNLNLRLDANTTSEKLATIPAGYEVGIIEPGCDPSGEWIAVSFNNNSGYVQTKYLAWPD